jgi:hypothetical protein
MWKILFFVGGVGLAWVWAWSWLQQKGEDQAKEDRTIYLKAR